MPPAIWDEFSAARADVDTPASKCQIWPAICSRGRANRGLHGSEVESAEGGLRGRAPDTSDFSYGQPLMCPEEQDTEAGVAVNAREITGALGGDWHGSYGLCPGPGHSPHDRSLKVSDGPSGLVVHSFAGERWQDIKDALRSQGLLPGRDRDRDIARQSMASPAAVDNGADIERRKTYAKQIWGRARGAEGTLVEQYLRGRGITLSMPAALRFAPELTHRPTGKRLPAMIAAVVDMTGRLQGVHRTFLEPDGSRRLQRHDAKMSLGVLSGGAVRLSPAEPVLAVAEGVETALSVQQGSGLPTWAALSAPGLQKLQLPREVQNVTVAVDGDGAGRRAGRVAANRWIGEGRQARIADPGDGLDFNDLLLGKCAAP